MEYKEVEELNFGTPSNDKPSSRIENPEPVSE